MKRCEHCRCIAFNTDEVCHQCGSTYFADINDNEITLRDGILLVAAMEKNAHYDQERCLKYLTDIVPHLTDERVMLGTAFNCGAVKTLRNGDVSNACHLMEKAGMSAGAKNVILIAYGFGPIKKVNNTNQPVTNPSTPASPPPTPTPVPSPPQRMPTPVPSPPQQTPPAPPTQDSLKAIVAIALIAAICFVILNIGGTNGSNGSSSTSATNSEDSNTSVNTDSYLDKQGLDRRFKGETAPIANLINGGHMASDENGTLYFSKPENGTDWDTQSIVKVPISGGSQTMLYSAPKNTINLYHLNVIGDRIIFNQVIEKSSSIMSISINGGDAKPLSSCDDWSLCQVYDGWVYYRNNGNLYRCDVDGKNQTSLANVGTNSLWRVAGNSLYYFNSDGDSQICASSIDGKNNTVVYHAPNGYQIKNAYPIDDNRLMILEKTTSGKSFVVRLYTISTDTTTTVIHDTSNIERICSYPEGVIATQKTAEGKYRIFSASYTGESPNLDVSIDDGNAVRYTCFTNNYIFFGEISNSLDCSIKGFAIEGGGIITY